MPELMQFEMGISTIRYLPASGTAGLERSFVNGKSRVPCPPPMMTHKTLLFEKRGRDKVGIGILSCDGFRCPYIFTARRRASGNPLVAKTNHVRHHRLH